MTEDHPVPPGDDPTPRDDDTTYAGRPAEPTADPAATTGPTDPGSTGPAGPTWGAPWGPPPGSGTEPAGTSASEPGPSAAGPADGPSAQAWPGGQAAFGAPGQPGGPGPGGTGGPGAQGGPDAPGGQGGPGGSREGPPPITAFAWRHGLVRPGQGEGRLFAGVCGAFGRATNTDPILWRVILVVLAVFGGVGVLVYLLGWLLLPAQGDTASPVEAVLGRGRSSTSAALTVIAAVIILISFGVGFTERFSPSLAALILIVIAALLLLRDRRREQPARPAATAPMWSSPPSVPVDTPSGGSMSTPTAFAPYGPYASTPPPTGPLPPAEPPRRRERSALGRLTFSVAILALGLVGIIDAAGASVPFAVYPATALAIVGIGLIIGGWYGRGRGLIALGIILTIMVGVTSAISSVNRDMRVGEVTWKPASLSQVDNNYNAAFGDATLDLTNVDFGSTSQPVDVNVAVRFGSLTILLPPNVDATVTSNVRAGNADVLGDNQSGVSSESNTVTDLGADGPGGGQLHLSAQVDFGNLEVRR